MEKALFGFVLLLTTIALTSSCGNSDKENIENVEGRQLPVLVRLPKTGEKMLNVSVFADTVIYIPLETTKESLIGEINQLWTNDSLILINSIEKGLMLFGEDGSFIRKIGKNGRGPGEYIRIFGFDVIGDTIYVSSTGRRSFLKFTFDGSFCGEVKFDIQPVFFTFTNKENLACYVHEEGKIYNYKNGFFNPETIVVEHGVTEGRYRYSTLDFRRNYLQKTSSGLLFNSYMSDTIWNITDNGKEPAFILNSDDELLPFDKQIEFSNGNFELYQQNAGPYSYFHLIPFQSLLFVFQKHYSNAGYDTYYISNLKTGEIKRFETTFIFDDLVGRQKLANEEKSYFFPDYVNNCLITSISALNLMKNQEDIEENGSKSPSDPWLDQMKNIKVNDNQVIVKIKVKDSL